MSGIYQANITRLCILAFFLTALAVEVQAGNDKSESRKSFDPPAQTPMAHEHHAVLSLPPGSSAPKLSIRVEPDPESGWNLQLRTANFRFSPENASRRHQPGEGHAHLYVNGKKRARLYGHWFHIDRLPKGDVELSVTLNSNDHRTLAVGMDQLRVTRTIPVN